MKLPFISITGPEAREMLGAIGVGSTEELFSRVPARIRKRAEKAFQRTHRFSRPLTEQELLDEIGRLAGKNGRAAHLTSFAGAGAYRHFVPSALNYVLGRSEFVTSYTPYQPEIAQGTLQSVFEFQSYIAMLTGMDIANASMYDGASACAESVLMAMRITGKRRVLVSMALHPHYREVIAAYTQGMDADIEYLPYESGTGATSVSAVDAETDEDTACVVVGYPNFFGIIEPLDIIFGKAAAKKALPVAVITEAMSTGMLMPPGRLGAAITAMECQSFGVPLSYGGPYIGVIAARKEFVRQLPGRLVGETVDRDGKRAYTLTLSTREQHIRREKATSNICSNEGLLAIAVAIYLSLMGKSGLTGTADMNHELCAYLRNGLGRVEGVEFPFSGPFFNEFVVRIKGLDRAFDRLLRSGYLPGVMLGEYYSDMKDCLLVNTTEVHSRPIIDRFIQGLTAL
ncbi:MAG: aminomethyl-transferring glycine dehydrogenase subunit GcvPA [Deltaproteobacteria bacterium]|nr:aminomethyl-transferring glycine dehydrogenase subunit GcvPA [Deltaproteobacteria bacterium]